MLLCFDHGFVLTRDSTQRTRCLLHCLLVGHLFVPGVSAGQKGFFADLEKVQATHVHIFEWRSQRGETELQN